MPAEQLRGASTSGALALLCMVGGLVFFEAEFLLSRNYGFRELIREQAGLPLYHFLLSFVSLGFVTVWLKGGLPVLLGSVRFSALPLALNGLSWAGVALLAARWPDYVARWGGSSFVVVALAGLAVMTLSGLAAVVPLPALRSLVKRHPRWLLLVAAASMLVPFLISSSSVFWMPLYGLTFHSVAALLGYLGYQPAVSFPDKIIGTGDFYVLVEVGCSGYEGIGLATVFTGLYLLLRREQLSFPTALLLLPLSWLLSWSLNVVRLAALFWLGSHGHREIAIRGFHSQAGWVAFTLLCVFLIWLCEHTRFWWLGRRTRPSYEAAPFLLPQVVAMVFLLFSSATLAGLDYLYPVRTLVVGAILWRYHPLFSTLFRQAPGPWGVLAGLLAYGLWLLLAETSSQGVSPYAVLSAPLAVSWLSLRVAGAALVVPLCEELAFRGYLWRRLAGAEPQAERVEGLSWGGAGLCSLAFALLHSDVVAAFACGMLYSALVRFRRGQLADAVLAHSVTNLALACQAIATGNWGLLG